MKQKLFIELTILEYLFLLIVIVTMFIYQAVKKEIEAEPNSTMKMVRNYGSTTIYSGIIIIFGTLYKKLILRLTEKTNHQYQKSWDDMYIIKLFTVNFINFYLPNFLVAFYTRMYEDLFTMIFSQMAFKQVALNLVEYFKPIFTI